MLLLSFSSQMAVERGSGGCLVLQAVLFLILFGHVYLLFVFFCCSVCSRFRLFFCTPLNHHFGSSFFNTSFLLPIKKLPAKDPSKNLPNHH